MLTLIDSRSTPSFVIFVLFYVFNYCSFINVSWVNNWFHGKQLILYGFNTLKKRKCLYTCVKVSSVWWNMFAVNFLIKREKFNQQLSLNMCNIVDMMH